MTQAGQEPQRGGRVLAVAPYVVLAALLAVVVRIVAVPVIVNDTLIHLRFGHEFLSGWAPWHPGHVSRFGQQDWWPTQWLSQILMSLADSVAGLAGVVWLSGLSICVLLAAVFVVARRHADPLPAVIVTAVTLVALSENLTPRPQTVSYLFVLLVAERWGRAARERQPPWLLVPATWVWALLHGMWPIGVVVGYAAVVGVLLDARGAGSDDTDRAAVRAALPRLLAVPALCLLAGGLTPAGPGLYRDVFIVGSRGGYHVEWGPTDFHSLNALAAAAMIAFTVVVWLRRPSGPTPWASVLVLLLAAAWLVFAVRTVPVSAVMMVPLTAAALQELVPRRRAAPRHERRLVVGMVVAALCVLAALVPSTSIGPSGVPVTGSPPGPAPPWLERALDQLPDGTAVQTDDNTGGWLMWRHPELGVVIDTYSDAYTTAYLAREFDIIRLGPGWQHELRSTGVRYALLPTSSRLGVALQGDAQWRVLHTSKDFVMLEER